jgi:hypothetical protein
MRSSSLPASTFDLLSVARIVFAETRVGRSQLHAVRGALGCDATFDLDHAYVVSGGCPCVDEFVDVLLAVWRYLSDRDPATVRSYGALARAHCRLRAVPDARRQRRGRQSMQKPGQLATGAIGRALATDRQRALLVDIVSEAGSAAPLDGDEQLLRRLAELRADRFGGSPESHRSGVCRDLPVVRAAADEHGARKRDSAGVLVSWWERYVESGLGKRERLHTVPVHDTPGDHGVDVPDPAAAQAMDAVLDRIVSTGLALHLPGELAHALADTAGTARRRDAEEPVRSHLLALVAVGAVPPAALDDDRLRHIIDAAQRLHRTAGRLR